VNEIDFNDDDIRVVYQLNMLDRKYHIYWLNRGIPHLDLI
jgi:hypothetical protein